MRSTRINSLLAVFFVLTLLASACSPSPAQPTATTSTSGNYPPPASTPAGSNPTQVVSSTSDAYPAQAGNPAGTAYPAQGTTPGSAYPGPSSGEITLLDGLNRMVTLPGPAQKIVSLAPSNTELLYEVGAGSQVIGRDEFSDFPADATALPSVGGSMGKYNLEAIAALKPDLVLAAQINTAAQVKSIQDLGLTVFYLNNPTDFNGLYQNIETVGKLTGRSSDAASLVSSLKSRVQAVTDRLAGITTHPKVYYELDATDPANPYTAGPGAYIDMLIKMAGGQNIGDVLSSAYAQISSEQVISANPDFIILGDAAYGITVDSIAQRPGWADIAAVKDGHVSTFDDNTVSRPTARMVDALENLARLLHPEAFK